MTTAEAECVALANETQEVTWLRELFKDLHNEQTKPTVIHEDIPATIRTAESPQYHSKTKHIDIKYHHVHEKVVNNTIKLSYCPTNEMLSGMMTKGLSKDKLKCLKKMTAWSN